MERASGYCNACPPFFIRYSTGTTFAATMDLHLTDEQAELLLAALDRIIDGDRYPLSARIRALREIRDEGLRARFFFKASTRVS